MEEAMAIHSSTLAWKIPWIGEAGRMQFMGSLRVRHDWATSLSLFTFMHWRKKWQPTPVVLPGESQGRRTLPVYGVAQNWTRLKWLSSSSTDRCTYVILIICILITNIVLILSTFFCLNYFFAWYCYSWLSSDDYWLQNIHFSILLFSMYLCVWMLNFSLLVSIQLDYFLKIFCHPLPFC